ncbi:hypothetical protein [Mesorhizobium sp. M0013]|uniref:hypothetical protein n=1 Tax=Mesorhizobium sp. M0013 TaxID=2956841 RepID=UPI00333615F7
MADKQDKEPGKPAESVVQRLVSETGITEEQARELVVFLGVYNWTSLLREARILAPKR